MKQGKKRRVRKEANVVVARLPRLSPQTIAIVGLGLMGGSLAAACRKKFPQARILGISRSRKALLSAKKKKWIHEASQDLGLGVREADLVVLGTPVDTFPRLLLSLERLARRGTVVTDLGSVKGSIVRWAERRNFKNIRFVGSHPMVGSHERGIEAAKPALYERGLVFLVRTKKTDRAAFRLVQSFWAKIAALTFTLGPEDHDRIVSQISHLPHLAAACLILSAKREFLRFASSGFFDTTRIAQGDASIWVPIFESNQKSILASLAAFEKRLREFKKALRAQDKRALARLLGQASRLRQGMRRNLAAVRT